MISDHVVHEAVLLLSALLLPEGASGIDESANDQSRKSTAQNRRRNLAEARRNCLLVVLYCSKLGKQVMGIDEKNVTSGHNSCSFIRFSQNSAFELPEAQWTNDQKICKAFAPSFIKLFIDFAPHKFAGVPLSHKDILFDLLFFRDCWVENHISPSLLPICNILLLWTPNPQKFLWKKIEYSATPEKYLHFNV